MSGNEELAKAAGQVLGWAWEKRDQIRAYLSELRDWWRGDETAAQKERPGILFLGAGGAGKSTLGRIISDEYNLLLDPPGEYQESISVEEYRLGDDPDTEILVPPGQSHRRDSTWNELLAGVTKGKYRGIVLINAYGYHTLGQISYRETKSYKRSGEDGFLESYLTDRRTEEVSVLSRIADAIRLTHDRVWMLSLISKQDLWWPQRPDVESHYREGKYGKIIDDLQSHCGRTRFRHEFAFACLVISNFETGMNERLRPNTEGYDQRLQVQSLRRLFEIIAALKQWENDK
jgi:hypothetical protein